MKTVICLKGKPDVFEERNSPWVYLCCDGAKRDSMVFSEKHGVGVDDVVVYSKQGYEEKYGRIK